MPDSDPVLPRTAAGCWPLLLGLTALNVLNFVDRYLVIAFANGIIRDLGLSHLQFGLLTGLAFTVLYTVVGLALGALADQVHRPRLIAGGLALWSAFTALTGASRNFFEVAAARVLVGVGEAALAPAALSLLAERVSSTRHAFAHAVYYAAIPVGIGASFMLAGVLGAKLGWRGSFVAMGLLGLAASLLVIAVLRDARASSERPRATARAGWSGYREVLRCDPALGPILVGATLAVFVQGAAVLDVVWWTTERGYDERAAQQLNGLLFLAGGVCGSLLGGLAADAAARRDPGGRMAFLAWALTIGLPVMIAFRLVPPGGIVFVGLAFVTNAVFMLVFGPTLATIQHIVPPRRRGAAVALFVLATALLGSAAGAAHVGWWSDHFTAVGRSEPLTWAIIVTQSWGLLAIPAFFVAARMLRRRTAATASAAT